MLNVSIYSAPKATVRCTYAEFRNIEVSPDNLKFNTRLHGGHANLPEIRLSRSPQRHRIGHMLFLEIEFELGADRVV